MLKGHRRQKPAALRELHGSSKRKHHHAQPAAPSGEPLQPSFLDDVAGAMWCELAGVLRGEKRLTSSDGPWLLATAEAFSDYIHWQQIAAASPRIINKVTIDGAGQQQEEPKAHPAHQQLRLARDAWRKLLAEGGVTPGARSRIAMPEHEDDDGDPFDAWQRRGKALTA